jgi:hypothetical protein
MPRVGFLAALSSASMILSTLQGCTLNKYFAPPDPVVPGSVAIRRALKLSSLTDGDRPFHLVLEIYPPAHPPSEPQGSGIPVRDMRAIVEIDWLNPLTYRTVIRSSQFTQVRIVNGSVVEEHNTGSFYPRWIQNFVDAIFDPIPQVDKLRKVSEELPVGALSHSCITNPESPSDQIPGAQICFQDAEPRLAYGRDFTRYVSFDDFEPFGNQQVPRTLINDLPANILVQGHIARLEPLSEENYPLLKAMVYTPAKEQLVTTLVSEREARSMLVTDPGQLGQPNLDDIAFSSISDSAHASKSPRMQIYVRTDIYGQVREAYRDSSDHYGLENAAVARALTLRFKPLMIDGVPHQMEAPLTIPSHGATYTQARN